MTTPSTLQRLRDADTVCDHCGERPAVCVGRYEDDGDPEYACDECCGHGNEDGWCVQFGEVGKLLTSWRRHRKEQEKTIDRMEAVVRAAESERDAYRAMLCDLLASAHPHPVEHPTMAKQWDRARELLKNGPNLASAGSEEG